MRLKEWLILIIFNLRTCCRWRLYFSLAALSLTVKKTSYGNLEKMSWQNHSLTKVATAAPMSCTTRPQSDHRQGFGPKPSRPKPSPSDSETFILIYKNWLSFTRTWAGEALHRHMHKRSEPRGKMPNSYYMLLEEKGYLHENYERLCHTWIKYDCSFYHYQGSYKWLSSSAEP